MEATIGSKNWELVHSALFVRYVDMAVLTQAYC